MTAPLLELREIVKSFGNVRALDGASLALLPGEVHALVGENGAGKTTLVSIAAGLLRKDGGSVCVGAARDLPDARAARAAGIALVPQHDLLVPSATVADNLALLDPRAPRFSTPAARRRLVREAEQASGLELAPPDVRAETLGVGARQRIAIAGALLDDPQVLVLDEPTAVMTPDESAALFRALRARAARGRAILVITHRLPEVFASADRLTLLSRGRTLLSARVAEALPADIAALLVAGAARAEEAEEGASGPGGAGVAAEALVAEGLRPEGSRADAIDLRLGARESLTLLAVDGNGAEEIAGALVGMRGREGRVAVAGRGVRPGDVAAFRAAGGAFVPGDRLAEGIVPELSIAENLGFASPPGTFLLSRGALEGRAREAIASFGIAAAGPHVAAGTLSGGNQQKLLLARELMRGPRLLVAVHPTRGLDLASSREIRGRLAATRTAGAALLAVTSDPDEARESGGTIRVVYRGRLSPPLPPDTPADALGRRLSGLET